MRRPRSHFFAGVVLAAIATSRVHAEAVPKAAESAGADPLSAIARQLGLPIYVVLALALVWGLITQADKLRMVWGWAQGWWAWAWNWVVKKPNGPSEAAPDDPTPEPPAGPALHNLPPRPDGFVGRAEALLQLAAELAPEGSQVVIHGLPGVGKTTLALRYAHEHRDRYPGGSCWLDASEGYAPLVRRAVAELEAVMAGLSPGTGLEPEPRLRRCWQAWPGDPLPVLLVVDNLPPGREGLELLRSVRTGLPSRFRCLITQRAEPRRAAAAIDLPVLTPDEALELLRLQAGESGRERIAQEPESARQLVAEVEGLPLALVLLAAHLERVPVLRVSELRDELTRMELGARAFQEAHADLLAEKGLVASLLTSWRTLSPEAMELARLLSLTLSAPIPWELIQRCEPAQPGTAPGRFWYEALADLLGANLLDQLAGAPVRYALHPLLRQFFAIQRQGWPREAAWRERLAASAAALAEQWEGEDASGAVECWRQACLADPTRAFAPLGLGYGLIRLGDLDGARHAFAQSRSLAEAAGEQRGISLACQGLGDVLVSQGDGAGALAAFRESLAIAEGLAMRDPANTQLQRDFFISQSRVADVLMAQGDGAGARAAYQTVLAAHESLAKRDPENTEWQRDLFVSQIKIGDVMVPQGDATEALAAYRESLAIAEGLAKREPANTLWQRDLSVSQEKIGDVLVTQGDGAGALATYRECLAIRESLAKRDLANTLWQRDLSVSQEKIGDVLVTQGDGAGALAAYRESLAIRESLAKRDPENTLWQRDLFVSHNKIGDMLVAQGDSAGALAAYRESLLIAEGLAKCDPANTEWQRDLSVSHNKIGDVLVSLRDGAGALAAYRECLAIRESLAKRDPANTIWQSDLSASKMRIGDALVAQGDGAGALAAYRESLSIAEGLAKRDPANTQWQVDVAICCGKLGSLNGVLPISTRKEYLYRGREILLALKRAERLHPKRDFTSWFDRAIDNLGEGKYKRFSDVMPLWRNP